MLDTVYACLLVGTRAIGIYGPSAHITPTTGNPPPGCNIVTTRSRKLLKIREL
jgi:hypothetical protein